MTSIGDFLIYFVHKLFCYQSLIAKHCDWLCLKLNLLLSSRIILLKLQMHFITDVSFLNFSIIFPKRWHEYFLFSALFNIQLGNSENE